VRVCTRRVISDSIEADRGNVATRERGNAAKRPCGGDEAFSDSEIDGIARNTERGPMVIAWREA